MTDDTERFVNAKEATVEFELSKEQMRVWIQNRRIKSAFCDIRPGNLKAGMYRVSDIKACIAKFTDDPVPEGYIKATEAIRKLGIQWSTFIKWLQRGKFNCIYLNTGGKSIRYVRETDVQVNSSKLSSVKATPGSVRTTRSETELLGNSLGDNPVLYGLLTEWDVSVLNQRRSRMQQIKELVV